jgi:hypothetical protein
MSAWLSANEAVVRVVCFGAIFAAVALAEIAVPRRGLTTSKRRRWTANIGIVIIDTAVLRIFFPAVPGRWASPSGRSGRAGAFFQACIGRLAWRFC